MAVTAAMVKELREMTGAGMMDCKKALSNTDGDMDKAVEYLRENGMAKAAKKAGRIAAEGIVKVVTEGNKAAIVEVNSETDFVAKNADFNAYVEEVAQQALNTKATDIDAFLAESWTKDMTNFSYIVFPTKLIACSSKFLGSVIPASFFSCSIFSCASFGVTTPQSLLNVFILKGILYNSFLYLATGEFVYLLNSANWFI